MHSFIFSFLPPKHKICRGTYIHYSSKVWWWYSFFYVFISVLCSPRRILWNIKITGMVLEMEFFYYYTVTWLVEICAHDFLDVHSGIYSIVVYVNVLNIKELILCECIILCECSVSARCSVGTWWYDRTLQRCARSSTTPQGTFVHTSLHSPRADAWSTHSADLFCRATPPVLRTNSRTDRKIYGLAQFLHVQDAQGHTHILVLLEEY